MPNGGVQPDRWALLIGIDRYPNFPEQAQLAGCVNDVDAMAGLLTDRFSFPADHVERLVDAAATQGGIRTAMADLIGRVGPDDLVVIQYSGHGSRMVDRTSPDGMAETIVASDSGRGTFENRDIADVELHQWLLQLTERTAHLTLIFDSCHSGHILRDPFGVKGRWVAPDLRPANELPPLPDAILRSLGRRRDTEAPVTGVEGVHLPLSRKYALLAGCRSAETSFEVLAQEAAGVQHGALTFHLCRELARAGAATTFRDLFEVVAPQVNALYPSQHPQLEGARDRQVFGLAELPPMRFVQVRQESGGELVLEAGAACGMTARSRWQVYPPGTKSLTSDDRSLGQVEITRVEALRSEARVLEGEIGAAGGRAVEQTHRYGDMRFAVEVVEISSSAAALQLRAAIAGSQMLCLHKGEGTAAARAYLLAPRADADGGPVHVAGPLASETWAVVGRDGELLMPLHAAAEPGVAGVLLENLEKRARFQFAMELADPGGSLSGKVRLALLGKVGDRWVERGESDGGDGIPQFHAGERIAFRISHSYPTPLFFYLLDFGLGGAVSLVYPAMGGEQKPASRATETLVGDGQGEEITLFLPAGFPFDRQSDAAPAGWTETVKVFATTREADFGVLVQQGMREGSVDPSPLGQLLGMSLTGHGTREMEVARPAAAGDWTVTQRSFRLLPG